MNNDYWLVGGGEDHVNGSQSDYWNEDPFGTGLAEGARRTAAADPGNIDAGPRSAPDLDGSKPLTH